MIVDVENRERGAILPIDNPAVIELSAAKRLVPLECVEVVSRDPQVAAVVIGCCRRTSISGPEVREFGSGFEPHSLDGVALDGGMEVALNCHFAIASKDARLERLEVKLEPIPGIDCPRRAPRAIGAREALIDEIVRDDPVSAGLSFARKTAAVKRVLSRLRDDDSRLEARANRHQVIEAAAAANKRSRDIEAPMPSVDVDQINSPI
jgi:hypothetical protein